MTFERDYWLQRAINSGLVQAAATNSSQLHDVMTNAPQESVARALAQLFRSGEGPPFAETMSHLFKDAEPDQRAAMLELLLDRLSEAAVASMPDGDVVARLVGPTRTFRRPLSAADAGGISPEQVVFLARIAEWHDPAIVDKMSCFCAQQPALIAQLPVHFLQALAASLANDAPPSPSARRR